MIITKLKKCPGPKFITDKFNICITKKTKERKDDKSLLSRFRKGEEENRKKGHLKITGKRWLCWTSWF